MSIPIFNELVSVMVEAGDAQLAKYRDAAWLLTEEAADSYPVINCIIFFFSASKGEARVTPASTDAFW